MLTCVRIVSAPFPRLDPPCVLRGTLCMCVCVFLPWPAPPLRPPDVHSPLI